MTVEQNPDRRPHTQDHGPQEAELLPVRWVVIIGLSAAVGIIVGAAQGVAAGVLAGIIAAGGINKLIK
ncbi:hypothetical protein B0E53_00094 [Micromonospora sp. MH33]|uniref:hypothetical protein n=1 Tax=Micromonospora sp. MH33 TaxID=1945509 RepID=UPI000D28D63C|nr:hypothetical protein [Micromonospora sp. MH33]PSK68019.1 hypothetical protein B0E53_00094 [Micromonospora sp. MH33]